MNWSEIKIWQLLAGLGLFLFGMRMLEEALKALAGRTFKIFLRKHTDNRVKAVLSGTLITAVLQSSTMVVLLVMSFAGAGLIGLSNGIGIVLGANLGTTITGWVVSLFGFKLDIKELIFPFLTVSGLGISFSKSEKWKQLSYCLMGFSLMFLGLGFMKDGFAEFISHFDIQWVQGRSGLELFLVAFVITALIHSSSAAMMIFLTALASGIISLEQALFMVIGADLGTTITAVTGTIGAKVVRKRIGWAQFIINIINAVLALVLMPLLLQLIQNFFGIKDPLFSMVAFHSLMNVASIVVMLPFLGSFTKMIERLIKIEEPGITEFIQKANPNEADSATYALRQEAVRFINQAIDTNKVFLNISNTIKFRNPDSAYNALQSYEAALARFCNIVQQNQLHQEEVAVINNSILAIRYASHSVKDVKDVRHNLDDLYECADELLFDFYSKLKRNQIDFYTRLENILKQLGQTGPSDLRNLMELQGSYFDDETSRIYELNISFSEPEIQLSSLLNMVREINNSNRELIRAISSFVSSKDKSD